MLGIKPQLSLFYGGTLDRVCKSAKTPIFSEIGKTEKSQKSEK
jgi:hypothetical protein